MKITAGLGSVRDLERYVLAGADEVFCGYVPLSWRKKYENKFPLNRREVLFYHVQIGTLEDMIILSEIAEEKGINVSVTFNSLSYRPEQLPLIASYILTLSEYGFHDYIVADFGLIRYLMERDIPCNLHISGELGEMNRMTLSFLAEQFPGGNCRITRIIFHRQNTIEDMESCIRFCREKKLPYEFEAFAMNEKCHFTGGFCNSLHCDELVHLCQIEYRLGTVRENPCPDEKGTGEARPEQEETDFGEKNPAIIEDTDFPGKTGCALCAIARLKRIGIRYLKVVGRGAGADQMELSIAALCELLESESATKQKLEKIVQYCNKNCYYL